MSINNSCRWNILLKEPTIEKAKEKANIVMMEAGDLFVKYKLVLISKKKTNAIIFKTNKSNIDGHET